MSREQKECVICGSSAVVKHTARIAGQRYSVCKLCAGAAGTLRQEGTLQEVLHCLHLTACEIEHFAEQVEPGPHIERWLKRLAGRLSYNRLRPLCECEACQSFPDGEPSPAFLAASRDTVIFSDIPGLAESFADSMPFNVLKSMADGEKLFASDGSTWRAIDEVARRLVAGMKVAKRGRPGMLAASATPLERGEWVELYNTETGEVRTVWRPIDELEREAHDNRLRGYWAIDFPGSVPPKKPGRKK